MKKIQIELYNIRKKLRIIYQIDEFSLEDYKQIIHSLNRALALCDVSQRSELLKAYTKWQDTTKIDLGAYTNEEQHKLYLDSF